MIFNFQGGRKCLKEHENRRVAFGEWRYAVICCNFTGKGHSCHSVHITCGFGIEDFIDNFVQLNKTYSVPKYAIESLLRCSAIVVDVPYGSYDQITRMSLQFSFTLNKQSPTTLRRISCHS
jgi:hypothetical protein